MDRKGPLSTNSLPTTSLSPLLDRKVPEGPGGVTGLGTLLIINTRKPLSRKDFKIGHSVLRRARFKGGRLAPAHTHAGHRCRPAAHPSSSPVASVVGRSLAIRPHFDAVRMAGFVQSQVVLDHRGANQGFSARSAAEAQPAITAAKSRSQVAWNRPLR